VKQRLVLSAGLAAAFFALLAGPVGSVISFPTSTNLGSWFDSVGPDGVVMAGFRLLGLALAGHAAVVFGLAVYAARRPANSALRKMTLRLAGPLWRRSVTAVLAGSLSIAAPFSGASAKDASARAVAQAQSADRAADGGPQRWPDFSSRPQGTTPPPLLIKIGDAPKPAATTSTSAPASTTSTSTTRVASTTTTAQPTPAPTTRPVTTTTRQPIVETPTRGASIGAPEGEAKVGPTRLVGSMEETWTVVRGQHFWSIAETVVGRSDPSPNDNTVAAYWVRLVKANRHLLPDPANADLLIPGTVLTLPSASEASSR
jgi:hypothetical protein